MFRLCEIHSGKEGLDHFFRSMFCFKSASIKLIRTFFSSLLVAIAEIYKLSIVLANVSGLKIALHYNNCV